MMKKAFYLIFLLVAFAGFAKAQGSSSTAHWFGYQLPPSPAEYQYISFTMQDLGSVSIASDQVSAVSSATFADGYAKLNEQIAKMSEEAISTPFDFAADPKKCGVRWQYDRCLRDLLIHLYEWQVLMREFVNNIREGHPRDYLPDEYRKNYHEMDKMLVEKHQNTPLEEANRLLQKTHEEMLRLAESFTEEELFTKGYYKNTYTTDMAAYFVSVTSSPYGQAVKLLKTHQKNLKK